MNNYIKFAEWIPHLQKLRNDYWCYPVLKETLILYGYDTRITCVMNKNSDSNKILQSLCQNLHEARQVMLMVCLIMRKSFCTHLRMCEEEMDSMLGLV